MKDDVIPDDLLDGEDLEEKPSKFKRIYLFIIGFLLVFIMISSTTFGSHVINIVAGKIVSTTLDDDYSFTLLRGKVIFEPNVYEQLRQLYLQNQKVEIKACLTGYKKGENWIIDGLYVPFIYHQDVHSVRSEMCNTETIVSLHSHPRLRCIFSEQDIRSYNRFRINNPDALAGLMCNEERLNFYGY